MHDSNHKWDMGDRADGMQARAGGIWEFKLVEYDSLSSWWIEAWAAGYEAPTPDGAHAKVPRDTKYSITGSRRPNELSEFVREFRFEISWRCFIVRIKGFY